MAGRRRASPPTTASRSACAPPSFVEVTKLPGIQHPLRFGLKLSGQDTTVEALRTVWRIADEGGFNHVWDFDHLAGGRLEFGIGAAWAEVEHTMYGIEGLDHRVGRLSESLRIIKSLWTEERTHFEGRYYRLSDAIANPKPIQKPYPPIWIGASGETTLRLVARHADVWNIAGGDPERVKELTAKLEEACGAVGRNPAEIRRSLQFGWDGKDRRELLELCGQLMELGVTEQVIYLRGAEPEALAGKIAEALPDLRKLERVAVVSDNESSP